MRSDALFRTPLLETADADIHTFGYPLNPDKFPPIDLPIADDYLVVMDSRSGRTSLLISDAIVASGPAVWQSQGTQATFASAFGQTGFSLYQGGGEVYYGPYNTPNIFGVSFYDPALQLWLNSPDGAGVTPFLPAAEPMYITTTPDLVLEVDPGIQYNQDQAFDLTINESTDAQGNTVSQIIPPMSTPSETFDVRSVIAFTVFGQSASSAQGASFITVQSSLGSMKFRGTVIDMAQSTMSVVNTPATTSFEGISAVPMGTTAQVVLSPKPALSAGYANLFTFSASRYTPEIGYQQVGWTPAGDFTWAFPASAPGNWYAAVDAFIGVDPTDDFGTSCEFFVLPAHVTVSPLSNAAPSPNVPYPIQALAWNQDYTQSWTDLFPDFWAATAFGGVAVVSYDYDANFQNSTYPYEITFLPAVGVQAATVGVATSLLGVPSDPFTLTFTAPSTSSLPVTKTGQTQTTQSSAAIVQCCNDPTIANTGEEHRDDVDLFVPGRGEASLEMHRVFRSSITFDGPIGQGWDFTYNEHIVIQPNGDALRDTGLGQVLTYSHQPNGGFKSPAEVFNVLVQQSDGTYVLREPSGFKRFFDNSGNLTALVDRNQNKITLTYAQGHLYQAVDPFGRTFTFAWTADGRINSVTDFSGRTVTYGYSATHDLTSVTTPAVVGTSTANDFPAGRTTNFSYTSGYTDANLNHLLQTVTAPVEVASGGPPMATMTYGTDPTDPSSYGRVRSTTFGGTNASGIPAGGLWTFQYASVSNPIAAGYPAGVVSTTAETDPDGNVTIYAFDVNQYPLVTRQLTRGVRAGDPAAFVTTKQFNSDGLLTMVTNPEGSQTRFTYDSANPSRFAQANVLQILRTPDATRGGGPPLVTTMTYEPLFNQVASITDPRGSAPGFTPAIGTATAARYTTKFVFDYQEGSAPIPEAQPFGIDLTGTARALGDLNGDGRTDQVQGNVVLVQAPSVTLLPGSNEALARGTTTEVVQSQLAWNDAGQYVRGTDPEGNVTTMAYYPENDPDGGGATVPGNLSTLARGYLKTTVRDAVATPARRTTAPPAMISTTVGYDPLGHISSMINPRGVLTVLEWSSLDELISVTRAQDVSRALSSGQLLLSNPAPAYKTRRFYDADGNVTKTQTENRDGNSPGLGSYVEQDFVYDILNDVVTTTVEVDPSHALTTQLRYDPNRLLTLVTKPEGNQVQTQYDERNLVYKVTRGFASTGAAPSTTTYNYDLDGNLFEILDALHVRGDGTPARTTFSHDGFDRVTTVTDPIGGQAVVTYDPVSHVVKRQLFGHPANQPTQPITLLAESRLARDELSRVFESDVAEFVAQGFATQRTPVIHKGALTPLATVAPSSDGTFVTTRVEYDALSRRTFLHEDNNQTSQWVYDGASRLVQSLDPVGNYRQVAYDQNSNPTAVTSTEISPESLVPNEVFTTLYVWDALDRLARVTDNAGQTATLTYDSRDQLTDTSDAVGPLVNDPLGLYTRGQINAAGNTTHMFHDGLGRLIKKVMDLRVGGQGGNALDLTNSASPNGTITTQYHYDSNSRLDTLFDDKGNATAYVFDELDRAVKEVASDGTTRTTTYDLDDNATSSTDANGTVVGRAFDNLNRLTAVNVTPSHVWSVGGTVSQTFNYDGASRLTKATDTNSDSQTTETDYAYDSLSRVLEETQDGLPVSSQWAGDGRRLALTYASGTALTFDHDSNKRLKDITEQGVTVAHWNWIGPGMRPLQRSVEDGVTLSFLSDTNNADIGWDAVQRVTRMRYVTTTTTRHTTSVNVLVDLGYSYDRANNRTSEVRYTDGQQDLFTYDSVYRLATAQYGQTVTEAKDDVGTVPSLGAVLGLTAEAFNFDGVNNRTNVVQTLYAPPRPQNPHAKTPPPPPPTETKSYATNDVNEYTSVADVKQGYDANGNLLDDGSYTYQYDFRNLLITVTEKCSRSVHQYRYDALGRRIEKTVARLRLCDRCEQEDWDCDDGVVATRRHVFDGARILEERGTHGKVRKEWVFGVGLDEPVRMTRVFNRNEKLYYCQNAIGSVVALTDARGQVVERYRYLAFGKGEVLGPDGETRSGSAYGNWIRFQGRQRDAETGLLYFRARYYDPESGRFINRDPIGIWGDPSALGNGYAAFADNPTSRRDPTGTTVEIAKLILKAALDEQSRRPGADLEPGQKTGMQLTTEAAAIDQRLAPTAIQQAVSAALTSLGITGVTPTVGNDLKANLTGADFNTISCALGTKLKGSTTISASGGAWSVPLTGDWELKIYLDATGAYQAAVGYTTWSLAHFEDAATYLIHSAQVAYPNGANAEAYLGRVFYDQATLDQVAAYEKAGVIKSSVFDSVIQSGAAVVGVMSIPTTPATGGSGASPGVTPVTSTVSPSAGGK